MKFLGLDRAKKPWPYPMPATSAATADSGKPRPIISVHGKKVDLSLTSRARLDVWRAECLKKLPATKKYQVIYADPPWQYNPMGNTHGRMTYPTMSQDDLKRLPVGQLADSTSVLFMWATNPLLPQALDVMRAWGFEYKTVFKVWLKRSAAGAPLCGIGWWSRPSTELLLVGTRGSGYMKWKRTNSEPQEFQSARGRHSEKPAQVRESVRTFMAVPNRIELFARTTAPGFDSWGLEIPGFLAARKVSR